MLDALNVISKNKNVICYNPNNEFFRSDDNQLRNNLKKEKKCEINASMKKTIYALQATLKKQATRNELS